MVRAGDIIASHDLKLFWQVSGSYTDLLPIDPFSDKVMDEKFLGSEPQCDALEVDIYSNMFLAHDFQQKDNIWIRFSNWHPHHLFRTKEEKALIRTLFL